MKILWFCNSLIEKVYELQNRKMRIKATGGWLDGLSERLLQDKTVQLYCIFLSDKTNEIESGSKENFYYCIIPAKNKEIMGTNEELVSYKPELRKMILSINPDVIHVFGTELIASSVVTSVCEEEGILDRLVISIQGLVSVYSDHYFDGISGIGKYYSSLQEIAKKSNMINDQKSYYLRGEVEKKTLGKVQYVIGRTEWDKACSYLMNPSIQYFFCNETLRKDFYTGEWSYNGCKKHTIYVSQASYPIKGFHMLLNAIPLVKRKYPDVAVYVAGDNKIDSNWVRGSGYYLYLKSIIKKRSMLENIFFLGPLDAQGVKARMLASNVYVSPSNIENSPNSLGEAMILGMPCISSDVGGVKDMLKHGEEGYIYPYNEAYMLAYYIIKVFDMQEKAEILGKRASQHAQITHNSENNQKQLMSIYQAISGLVEQ